MAEDGVYEKVMAQVEKNQPTRVEEFKGWCQYFGGCPTDEAEQKGEEFYKYLVAAFGHAFAQGIAPELAQLLPDEHKKTVLLKKAGIEYVSPAAAGALGGQAAAAGAVADPNADPMAFLAQQAQDEADKKAVTQKTEEQLKAEAEEKALIDEENRKRFELIDTKGLSGTKLADANKINAEKEVMKRLHEGNATMWEMTKMAFKLGLGEANVAKAVTNEQTQAARAKVNHTVANSVDSYNDKAFADLKSKNTQHYMHEPQHTIQEIIETLRDDCLWEDKEGEYAILKNAEAMVKDQVFKAGGAEQLIKSWLVQKVGNSLLGTLNCIVLVLTSGSFYQVNYDPVANKLTSWPRTFFNSVAYILSDRTQDGAPCMTYRTRSNENVTLFGFAAGKLAEMVMDPAEQVWINVQLSDTITTADYAATTLEMVRAFQQVHRRFITSSENVEKISRAQMESYKASQNLK